MAIDSTRDRLAAKKITRQTVAADGASLLLIEGDALEKLSEASSEKIVAAVYVAMSGVSPGQ